MRLTLALFYLMLGVSAAWHAPHFSRGDLAIGKDRHEHHEAVNSDSCALCTVKKAPHQAVSVTVFVGGSGFAVALSPVVVASVSPAFAAFSARGPPAPLS